MLLLNYILNSNKIYQTCQLKLKFYMSVMLNQPKFELPASDRL